MSSTGCVVPQLLAAGRNRSSLEIWAITGDLWYPGYKTPTKTIFNGTISINFGLAYTSLKSGMGSLCFC
jgi:hypothetical protein